MINLELSKKHEETFGQVMMLAEHMMRPYSRKYDKEEHTYPKEMEEVAKLIGGARSAPSGPKTSIPAGTVVNGGNMGAVVGLFGLCWGDVGLFLAMPGRYTRASKKIRRQLRRHVYYRTRHRLGLRQHQHHGRGGW
jgi:acyl-CoA dehydrogenase